MSCEITLEEFIEAYNRTQPIGLRRKGVQYSGPCPVEQAGTDRFFVSDKGGKLLVGCRYCEVTTDFDRNSWFRRVLDAVGLDNATEIQKPVRVDRIGDLGCTISQLSEKTGLTIPYMESLGWKGGRKLFEDLSDSDIAIVIIPRHDRRGIRIGTKYRIRFEGPDHYRNQYGTTPGLLGEDWIIEADGSTDLVIVEGETDYATLRLHGVRVAGVPGTNNTGVIDKNHLNDVDRILVVAEQGEPGRKFPVSVEERVRELGWMGPVLVIKLDAKDTNQLYRKDPERFLFRFEEACRQARGNVTGIIEKDPQYVVQFSKNIRRTKYPPIRWVIPGLLPAGASYLVGDPKNGKSLLALEIALAVASGIGTIGGKWRANQGDVLYLNLEQKTGEATVQRLEMVSQCKDYVPEGWSLAIIDKWPPIGEGCFREIDLWLRDHPKCSLIIIDVIASVWVAKFEGNAYIAEYKLASRMNRLAEEHNTCILGIHHTRKSQSGGDSMMDRASGTRAMTGGASALWWITREVGQVEGRLGMTDRLIGANEWEVFFDSKTLRWTIGDLVIA